MKPDLYTSIRPVYMQSNKKNVFDTGSGDITDSNLDLPAKLSILFKRGLGGRYVKTPDKLDAPLKQTHAKYLKTQFAKASYDYYTKSLNIDIDRKKSFEDFNSMDYTPEISSALDIYADECLTKSEYGEILKISSDNNRIKKILENLFYDVLDIDHNLWHWTRSTCKYGNHFMLLDVQVDKGVVGYLELPINEMRREEAYDGNINSVKFIWDTNNMEFDNWQIAHFRLIEDQRRLPYGTSSLESSRLIWKQLQLSEDAMMVYRISRAPERRVFYIDVGNIDPSDIPQYITNIKNILKRTPQVNETTGNINFKYNSMAVDEDFFIPRRNDKNSEIDTLPGASNLDEIADIEYLQRKLFSALKIPKAYLTFDEDINAKATLASEDIRFARTVNRIQQAIITTLNQIAVVHLFSLGFRDKDQLTEFKLELTNPSTTTDLEKLGVWEQKANVFRSLWDENTLSPISWVWGMKNIFNFSDDEIRAIAKQQHIEGKIKVDIETEAFNDEIYGMDQGMYDPTQTAQTQLDQTQTAQPSQESIDMMLKLIPKDIKKVENNNRSLIVNSLSNDNTYRMLINLQENLEKSKENKL